LTTLEKERGEEKEIGGKKGKAWRGTGTMIDSCRSVWGSTPLVIPIIFLNITAKRASGVAAT